MNTGIRPERDISLDLIRSVCILFIVGYWHLFNYTDAFPGYNNFITWRLTTIVLGSFALISGFLAANRPVETIADILQFYIKRLLRIYPLYLLAIISFLVIGETDGVTLLKAAFLVSMFYKPVPPTLWYITMLMFFYVLSPFLVLISKSIVKYCLFVAAVMLFFVLYGYFIDLLDIRIALYFPAFALGILMSRKRGWFRSSKEGIYSIAELGLLILSVLLSLAQIGTGAVSNMMDIPMVATGALFFYLATGASVNRAKVPGFITLMAYGSFCMYLFHRPIYYALKSIYFPESGVFQVLYLYVVCLPAVIGGSLLVQKAYDSLVRGIQSRSTKTGQVSA